MLNSKNLIALVLLAAAAMGVYGGILPIWQGIQGDKAMIEQINKAAGDASSAMGRIDAGVRFFNEELADEHKERAYNALPLDEDTPNLLVLFDDAVKESGLSLDQLSFKGVAAKESKGDGGTESATKENRAVVAVPVIIRAVGKYESIKKLVVRLESMLRVNDVERIQISPAVDKEQTKEGAAPKDVLEVEIQTSPYRFNQASSSSQ